MHIKKAAQSGFLETSDRCDDHSRKLFAGDLRILWQHRRQTQ
jgi:hypothetical protein